MNLIDNWIIMIRLTKKKHNPILADYGYHATSSKNLKSIKEKGLIPGYFEKKYIDSDLVKVSSYFYNNKQPIYFADLPDINRIPETLKYHFENQEYDIWLKVDVSDFNQYPDILMLILDFGFRISNNHLFPKYDIYYEHNKSLTKLLKKYDEDIPFESLKTDDDLISELILLTGTFVVNQKITPNYIKGVIPIKYD